MAEIDWSQLDTNAAFKGAQQSNALLQGLARIKAGNQINANDTPGAEQTMNSVGDISGAQGLEDRVNAMDTAKRQRSAQMTKDVADALENVRTTHGNDAVLPAFEHLVPMFKQNGASDADLDTYRQAIKSNPEFLTTLSKHADDHLKGYNLNPGEHHFDANNQDVASVAPKAAAPFMHNAPAGSTVLGADGKPIAVIPGKPAAGANGQAGSEIDPNALETATNQYVTTGTMPALGMNGGSMRSAILANAEKKLQGLGYSSADIPSFASKYKSLNTALGQMQAFRSKVGAYEGTVQDAIGLIDNIAPRAMTNSGINAINRAGNWWKTETGDPDMAQLHNAISSVVNEYAKVISNATGGGVTSDAATKRAESMLNSATSLPALKAQISILRKEMGFRVKNMDSEIASIQDQTRNIIPGLGKTSPTTGAGVDFSKMSGHELDAALAGSKSPQEGLDMSNKWLAAHGKKPLPSGTYVGPAENQPKQGQFTNGQVYKDAQGKRARYNNGQWEELP